jgi:hypothetical protein
MVHADGGKVISFCIASVDLGLGRRTFIIFFLAARGVDHGIAGGATKIVVRLFKVFLAATVGAARLSAFLLSAATAAFSAPAAGAAICARSPRRSTTLGNTCVNRRAAVGRNHGGGPDERSTSLKHHHS